MESSDGEEWGREEEADGEEEDGERGGEPGGRAERGAPTTPSWTCTQCHTCYTDKENYITHMAELHGKVNPFSFPFLLFSRCQSGCFRLHRPGVNLSVWKWAC